MSVASDQLHGVSYTFDTRQVADGSHTLEAAMDGPAARPAALIQQLQPDAVAMLADGQYDVGTSEAYNSSYDKTSYYPGARADGYAPGSGQYRWMAQDLSAHSNRCTLVTRHSWRVR